MTTTHQVERLHRRPTFDDPLAERADVKGRLAAAFRLFARFGLNEGLAGHITARDPIHPDHFWVNPLGMSFRLIKASDLVRVDAAGEVVEGRWEIGRAAFAIHSRIHEARPDVMAAAHAHGRYGRAWSTLGRLPGALTQEACAYYDDCGMYDGYEGVVLELAEGDRIAEALGPRKACILRNHGLLTVGQTVDEAAWWFLNLEGIIQVQLMAEASGGEVRHLTPEEAEKSARLVGTPDMGWRSFQPLYDDICAEQPDLLS